MPRLSVSHMVPFLVWMLVFPMASVSLPFLQKCLVVGIFNTHYTLGECMICESDLPARQKANALVFTVASVALGREWIPAVTFVNCFVSCFDLCTPFRPEYRTVHAFEEGDAHV